MTDLSNLINLCSEAKRLDTDEDYGSDEQIDSENALYEEAERIAKIQDREDELEDFFSKTLKALSGERAQWLMEFFGVKEAS
jgi:hypothetical protein